MTTLSPWKELSEAVLAGGCNSRPQPALKNLALATAGLWLGRSRTPPVRQFLVSQVFVAKSCPLLRCHVFPSMGTSLHRSLSRVSETVPSKGSSTQRFALMPTLLLPALRFLTPRRDLFPSSTLQAVNF